MIHLLKVLLLYLFPHHALSRMVQWSARCHNLPLHKTITHWFIRRYKVNMSEAQEQNPDAYPDFNGFFTRALRSEVRPVVQETGQICCPNDGTISQIGNIESQRIFQAKRHDYSLIELLGGSEKRAQPFINGSFATMYLSPGDYHRVHMPLSGQLLETVTIPGRLFSVSPDFTETVPHLFARNERVACFFQTEAGPMVVILVGAIFVGSIETIWAGEITPPSAKEIRIRNYTHDDNIIQLQRGEELGRFNMGGSTIIVLFGPGRIKWQSELGPETRIKFGELLGQVIAAHQ